MEKELVSFTPQHIPCDGIHIRVQSNMHQPISPDAPWLYMVLQYMNVSEHNKVRYPEIEETHRFRITPPPSIICICPSTKRGLFTLHYIYEPRSSRRKYDPLYKLSE